MDKSFQYLLKKQNISVVRKILALKMGIASKLFDLNFKVGLKVGKI